jgi:hypothetical protein
MSSVVIAAVSDIHAGGSTALCPKTISLDDGGKYKASKAQQWIFQCWKDYWKRVGQVVKAESAKLYQVFDGDAVEGQHHHSTQILSGNPNAQAAVLTACMEIPLALKPAKMFWVRGTETHVGASASAEERIADGLRRDKRPIIGDPETGTASWWHLRMEVNGVLIDVAHHGRTGQREHTRASQAVLHSHDILLSHVKAGHRPPDLCIRGHYHKFNDSHDACQVRVVTSGAWQLKTSHVHKIAADSISDIGGLIVVVKNGSYSVEKVHFKPTTRGPVWRG